MWRYLKRKIDNLGRQASKYFSEIVGRDKDFCFMSVKYSSVRLISVQILHHQNFLTSICFQLLEPKMVSDLLYGIYSIGNYLLSHYSAVQSE